MALISCPECHQSISDKATTCPHCGSPIVRKVRCSECGKEMDEGTPTCPNCGCPQTPAQPEPPRQFASRTQSSSSSAGSVGEQRVQRFLMANKKYFPVIHTEEIRTSLLALNDSQMNTVECLQFKDPIMTLIVSFLLGGLGIDRFMLGDTLYGVLKLITGGGCGIWWLIDLFFVSEKTQEVNYKNLKETLNFL